MIRHVAAVAVVLCLTPSWLCAQSLVLTVKTESASVHKAPSNGSPVIGSALRGATLQVTRELGSWVKISWPAAQDGAGYVHVSTGSIAQVSSSAGAGQPAATTSARPAREGGSPTIPPIGTGVQRPGAVAQAPRVRPVYVTPATHSLGLGARVGGVGFGVTARTWRRNRVGIQLELSHYSLAAAAPAHVTSVQFEPSLLYALRDRIGDSFWLRPYVGSGVNFGRLRLDGSLVQGNIESDDRFGLQAFGGGEVTFAGMPRFALSADVRYRWSRAPFAGVEPGGMGVSVSGHWYVR